MQNGNRLRRLLCQRIQCNERLELDQWSELEPLTKHVRGGPLSQNHARSNPSDTHGVSAGVQLFRDHQNESFIPEVAYEEPQGESVWGIGLRWQRKLGPRVYIDALGVMTWSDNEALDREGIFVSTFFVF